MAVSRIMGMELRIATSVEGNECKISNPYPHCSSTVPTSHPLFISFFFLLLPPSL
ncbi:uncharacterized protein G2W53_009124 [Senna tora]|uniref:Uncharacterized protein n=1 Tax=Senna tora TaxID=362788 RepID=A0A834WXQ6_9FABA|nr:uncharacterized protein G2W53_009124 [Senna tora]